MRQNLNRIAIIVYAMSFFSGCISWHSGIEPIEPSSGTYILASKVNSIQPTLSWEPSALTKTDSVEDLRYQLIVLSTGMSYKVIYTKKDILETSHTVETALQPDTRYGWRVRPIYKKNGQEIVGDWNGFNFIGIIPPYFGWVFGNPYFFATP
jgi:hypothetical protein